ncbi:hypothetical protein ACA910_010715 [Epithemia clementina (nom. ined.)]
MGSNATSSPTIESLLSVDQCRVFCNDAQGLPLGVKSKDESGSVRSDGVYSNLTRLAAKLESSASTSSGNSSSNTSDAALITIETDAIIVLVKEYSGYTVGIQLPRAV